MVADVIYVVPLTGAPLRRSSDGRFRSIGSRVGVRRSDHPVHLYYRIVGEQPKAQRRHSSACPSCGGDGCVRVQTDEFRREYLWGPPLGRKARGEARRRRYLEVPR